METLNESSANEVEHMYMGDGVYICFDGYGYILRSNHHASNLCTDEIYIEPSVMKKLINYNSVIEANYK